MAAVSLRDDAASWRIVPLATPRVWRYCPHCQARRPFACSDKFRLNANQQKVDVWLIYRCVDCDKTWNYTLFTRCTPQHIGSTLYQKFQQNDQDTAWAYAFDRARLQRLGGRVDAAVPVRVHRILHAGSPRQGNEHRIVLELPYPCAIRLDRLLASELGVSRACLAWGLDCGLLRVFPDDQQPLRKPIQHGQILVIHGSPETWGGKGKLSVAARRAHSAEAHDPHKEEYNGRRTNHRPS
jgi:hypothetical protein